MRNRKPMTDLEAISDNLHGLTNISTLPIEDVLARQLIDVTQYETTPKHRKQVLLSIETESEADFTYRMAKIERIWGSRANFFSAMLWLFSQDIISNGTMKVLRALWDASNLPDELREFSHEELLFRIGSPSFWEEHVDVKDGDALTRPINLLRERGKRRSQREKEARAAARGEQAPEQPTKPKVGRPKKNEPAAPKTPTRRRESFDKAVALSDNAIDALRKRLAENRPL